VTAVLGSDGSPITKTACQLMTTASHLADTPTPRVLALDNFNRTMISEIIDQTTGTTIETCFVAPSQKFDRELESTVVFVVPESST